MYFGTQQSGADPLGIRYQSDGHHCLTEGPSGEIGHVIASHVQSRLSRLQVEGIPEVGGGVCACHNEHLREVGAGQEGENQEVHYKNST